MQHTYFVVSDDIRAAVEGAVLKCRLLVDMAETGDPFDVTVIFDSHDDARQGLPWDSCSYLASILQ